jgi:[acyl-carrier-protein] S-malonyltransferase
MSAVVGGAADDVAQVLAQAGLVAANRNGAKQVVAAGPLDLLERLAAAPPPGTRVVPLDVAGAFHTDFMAPATSAVREVLQPMHPRVPGTVLLSNEDGQSLGTGPQVLQHLADQVSRPVRWDLVQQQMSMLGVDTLVELAPGGVLKGLARREMPGVTAHAITTPEDIEQLTTAAIGVRA